MIATKTQCSRASFLNFADARLDLAKCLSVVKRVDIDVTHVERAQSLEHAHLHLLAVVTAAHRGLTDGVRPKAGPWTRRHQTIERNAQHGQIKLLIVDSGSMRQTTKCGDATERRLMMRSGRTSFMMVLQSRRSNSISDFNLSKDLQKTTDSS